MVGIQNWRPKTRYAPDVYDNDVRNALDVLNWAAEIDEETGWAKWRDSTIDGFDRCTRTLEILERKAVDKDHHVISFDIDLTLDIGIDPDRRDLIPTQTIKTFQQMGWVVGTCSDRPVSGQKEVMAGFYQRPDFYIPKELLDWTKRLLPADVHVHVGDDDQRDRDIAVMAGWQHMYPGEFKAKLGL